MISTGELKKGLTIIYDNNLMRIVDFQHVKQGRGSAYVRLTLRNVRTGATVNTTIQAGEKYPVAQLEKQGVQFLYREDDSFHFMNTETYDQPVVGLDIIGEAANYLKENEHVDLMTYEGEVLDIVLPPNVVLRVDQTEPGYKGDTASGAVKPAIMETGLRVMVPLFVSEGDDLRIDTRDGSYIERA
ncbi:MAG: elongation factor P [Chloroflexi bacterium SZAS-1]|jgi:elongation factor P|nr:elongation factor P [Chloroflexi bacterium SZAS-1]HNP85059.1 elongation factor P [Kouleothrix sp.]